VKSIVHDRFEPPNVENHRTAKSVAF